MKKRIFKLTGVKLGSSNLVIDGPIKELGARGKFELARQLSELQGDVEFYEDKLDETKVTGKG